MKQTIKFHLAVLGVIFSIQVSAQVKNEMRYADKIRIREALTISAKYGDKLWKGFNSAPFAVLLVTDSLEYLINHPSPTNDFVSTGMDEVLKANIYIRKRQFNIHFLATFNAVNGFPCIVVGTPENTGKNSSEWIITLLHEHFHQYQYSSADYYKNVNELNLSRGDQTGMWMLNYPFPYDSLPVIKQFESFSSSLYNTVKSLNSRKEYRNNLKLYFTERKKLKNLLQAADYSYFSLQVWQEGLARYTEYKILQLLDNYSPTSEISRLADFIPFSEVKLRMYKNETENLLDNNLNKVKRICFYSTGFAEGLILDKLNNSWRNKYLKDKFFVEQYSKKFK